MKIWSTGRHGFGDFLKKIMLTETFGTAFVNIGRERSIDFSLMIVTQ